jgi:hypothetical protein
LSYGHFAGWGRVVAEHFLYGKEPVLPKEIIKPFIYTLVAFK